MMGTMNGNNDNDCDAKEKKAATAAAAAAAAALQKQQQEEAAAALAATTPTPPISADGVEQDISIEHVFDNMTHDGNDDNHQEGHRSENCRYSCFHYH